MFPSRSPSCSLRSASLKPSLQPSRPNPCGAWVKKQPSSSCHWEVESSVSVKQGPHLFHWNALRRCSTGGAALRRVEKVLICVGLA